MKYLYKQLINNALSMTNITKVSTVEFRKGMQYRDQRVCYDSNSFVSAKGGRYKPYLLKPTA